MDTTRPIWMPAQVTVDASTDFRIILEGQATNGGFAVDDITFTPGSCPSMYLGMCMSYTIFTFFSINCNKLVTQYYLIKIDSFQYYQKEGLGSQGACQLQLFDIQEKKVACTKPVNGYPVQ